VCNSQPNAFIWQLRSSPSISIKRTVPGTSGTSTEDSCVDMVGIGRIEHFLLWRAQLLVDPAFIMLRPLAAQDKARGLSVSLLSVPTDTGDTHLNDFPILEWLSHDFLPHKSHPSCRKIRAMVLRNFIRWKQGGVWLKQKPISKL
jgi:hypothetical protein